MSDREREACRKAWNAWQDEHGFPHTDPDPKYAAGWQARAQQDISEAEREFLEAACLYFQNHKALEDAARRNDRSITDVLPRIGKAYVRARAAHDALLAAQQQGEEGGGDV